MKLKVVKKKFIYLFIYLSIYLSIIQFKEINIKITVYNYCFNYLIKAKRLETKNILINEQNLRGLVIYVTRYDHGKSVRMLSLYYHELMGNI